MAKDYKDRGSQTSKKRRATKKPEKAGRWILIGSLIFIFVAFLVFLKYKPVSTTASTVTKGNDGVAQSLSKAKKTPPVEPKFDYYTILPDAEIEVPDHEIKTRIREEMFGKVKATQYTVQAGAFRNFKDADRLKAELALMGIASKIEKAKVGNVLWSRVKLGPYTQLKSVEQVTARLKKSNIDAIITEGPK